MTNALGDDEFVGYLFRGAPERRPRLWFLDRHLKILLDKVADWTVVEPPNVGTWTWLIVGPGPAGDLHVRYEHQGDEPWTAVWRLTGTTIPRDPDDAARGFGITTFGRDDDVWRLALWPD